MTTIIDYRARSYTVPDEDVPLLIAVLQIENVARYDVFHYDEEAGDD